ISAAYSGNTNLLASQSGAISQVVGQAASRSGVAGRAVRNRRGQIVAMNLNASVLVISPGGGIPTRPVTFFVRPRKLGPVSLGGGTAVLSVRAQLVMNKVVTAQYAGNANYLSSISPKVKITRSSTAAVARPFLSFAHPARSVRPRWGR